MFTTDVTDYPQSEEYLRDYRVLVVQFFGVRAGPIHFPIAARRLANPSNPIRGPRHHHGEAIVGPVYDHRREDVGVGIHHLGTLEFDAGF